jgi:acetoin utilization deacetylase AcuC-like enzyme
MMKFLDTFSHLTSTYSPAIDGMLISNEDDVWKASDNVDVIKKWLSPPHDKCYVSRFLNDKLSAFERNKIGFKDDLSRQVINRTLAEISGTCLTCDLALSYGLATNLAGGTHHSFSSHGSGYTILNDLVIASNYVMQSKGLERVLVIDCDVHQGDGTSSFLGDPLFKDKLFTLDFHCESNFPFVKLKSTHDVPLRAGTDDEGYMKALYDNIPKVVDEIKPDLIIYDAGVDVLADDRLGKLDLTLNGMRRRDYYVIQHAVDKGIPIACVVGGGYDKDRKVMGMRHGVLAEEAGKVWREREMWERIDEKG